MTPDVRSGHLADAFLQDRLTRRQFVERALGLGLSTSAAAALMVACQRAKPASLPAKPKRLSGTVLVFAGFGTGNHAIRSAVQQALAEAFILIHPQVGIDFVGAATPAAARSQFDASLSHGPAPDLVLPLGVAEISRLVDQNAWLDLSPLLARDGLSLDRFLPTTFPAARLTSYYGRKSNTVVGLPVAIHDHALAYNEDLFAKARVPVPPASWTDSSWTLTGTFLDTARAVTLDAGGRHPGQSGFDPSRVTQYGIGGFGPEMAFYDLGGHLYDPASRRAQFDQPGSMAGIQFAADLIGKHHVQPTPTQAGQYSWASGRVAMIDMCSCEIRSASATPGFAWQAAALPAGPARRFGLLEVDLGAIPAASANRDLAWELLKFLAVDPANERRLSYDGLGAMPPLKDNRDAFVTGLKTDAPKVDPTPWTAGLASASIENDDWIPAFSDVHILAKATFDQIVGGAAAGQAIPQLQHQSQARIDAWFKTHKLGH